MANPLKEKLEQRFFALQKHRQEIVLRQRSELATLDEQIAALRDLAQQWDTMTVDEALAALDKTGIRLDVQS